MVEGVMHGPTRDDDPRFLQRWEQTMRRRAAQARRRKDYAAAEGFDKAASATAGRRAELLASAE